MHSEYRAYGRCGCAVTRARQSDSASFVFPGTGHVFERDRPFLLRHLALDLRLDVEAKAITGTATLTVERIAPDATELRLDAVGFVLEEVRCNGEVADFAYDGDVILVRLEPTVAAAHLVITYRAVPRRGLYFLAPDEHVRDRPRQVWSQCQDEDARYWVPCLDKPNVKQTTELRVWVPAGWYALSNGALVERHEEHGGEVFHWKLGRPHAAYLLTLVAGKFSELDGGHVENVPVTYLVPPGLEADGRQSFAETPAMIQHFSALTGVPFPWEKYAQVVVADFFFGGMENTTATTLYEHVILDEKARVDLSSHDLIAHELAHQWFGDYVTCRDWTHGWLNEGFATYFEHLDRERRLGLDEYEYGLKLDQDAYLTETRERYHRPVVCAAYDAPVDLFDRHLYEKGGLILHMLRRQLGDATFWQGVGDYLRRHAFGLVETRDLCRALENVSGRSLERFFHQWLYQLGHPEVTVKIEIETEFLLVHVQQTSLAPSANDGRAAFAFDLEVDVASEDEVPRRMTFSVTRPVETFAVPVTVRPSFVVVDPRHRILGDVRLEVPAALLRRQLHHAPTARGRWLAAQGLGRRDDPDTHTALRETLHDENAFWGLRAEVAAALATLRSAEARAILLAATSVLHPKVRRAVAKALGSFRHPEAAAALRPLALADASYAVEAASARALGATRQPTAFDTLVELLDRTSWSDIVRVGALDGLGALQDERALPHLTARITYGHSSRVRQAAVRALGKMTLDRTTRERLEALLDDSDVHLRVEVAEALGALGDPRSGEALRRAADRDLDGRARRAMREVLRDLTSPTRADPQKLADELERLRGELGEMRGRLAKLEAKDESPNREKLTL